MLERVLAGRRILLTGATGFLGKTFLYVLLRYHPEVERIYLLIRGDRRSSQNRYLREVVNSPVLEPLRAELGARFEGYLEDRIVVVPGDIPRKACWRKASTRSSAGRSTRLFIVRGWSISRLRWKRRSSPIPWVSPT